MDELRKSCVHGRFDPHTQMRYEHQNDQTYKEQCPGGSEPNNDELIALLVERKTIIDMWEAPDPHNQPNGVVVLFEGEFEAQRVNAETST